MKNRSGNKFLDYLQLSRITIMIPVSLTGFTGYFIFSPHVSIKLVLVTFGILLMAVSASALNQIQEKTVDGRMERTLNRPLPSGTIKTVYAAIFFLVNLATGFALIYLAGNLKAALTGLFAILWYNGLYTYLKRIMAFAVIPGAVTGALPPVIGWVAAGGGFSDKPAIYLAFLFFTGQIPHFWLLILKYGEEYSKAGMPALTDIFTRSQINRLTFTWTVTSVAAAIFLCYIGIIRSGIIIIILLAASFFLIWKFVPLIRAETDNRTYEICSRLLYAYFLLVIILLIIDRVTF